MAGGPKRAADAPPLGNCMAIFAIVKGMIGAGILGLPAAFGKVGLALSVPGSLIIGVISAVAAYRLCETKLVVMDTGTRKKTYEGAFSTSDESGSSSDDASTELPDEDVEDIDDQGIEVVYEDYGLGAIAVVGNILFGKVGVVAAGLSVFGTQAGLCVAYSKVIMETLLHMTYFEKISPVLMHVIVCTVLCLLSMVRKLGSLASLSLVALAAYFFVFLDLIYNALPHIMSADNISFQDAWVPIHGDHAVGWFGTTVFAFEGIVLAQYVCDDMKLGTDLKPFKGVLAWSYGSSWFFFASAAMVGFLAYGELVKAPFYESFPQAHADTIIDKFILVFVLLLTFALQAFPIFSCFDYFLINQKRPGNDILSDLDLSDDELTVHLPHHTFGKTLMDVSVRFGTTIAMFVVGSMMPKVGCVTDLVGAVFMSPMAFILPGLFHFAATRRQSTTLTLVFDALLVVIGTVSLIMGFATAPACFSSDE